LHGSVTGLLSGAWRRLTTAAGGVSIVCVVGAVVIVAVVVAVAVAVVAGSAGRLRARSGRTASGNGADAAVTAWLAGPSAKPGWRDDACPWGRFVC
jgi:hypothetical protein